MRSWLFIPADHAKLSIASAAREWTAARSVCLFVAFRRKTTATGVEEWGQGHSHGRRQRVHELVRAARRRRTEGRRLAPRSLAPSAGMARGGPVHGAARTSAIITTPATVAATATKLEEEEEEEGRGRGGGGGWDVIGASISPSMSSPTWTKSPLPSSTSEAYL